MKKPNQFLSIVDSDIFSIRKQKSTYILFGFMMIALAISYLLYFVAQSGDDITRYQTGASQLYSCLTSGVFVLFFALITVKFVSGSFSGGTVKLMVARGASRTKIYFSKLLVLFALLVIYSLAIILLSGIITAFTNYGSVFDGKEFGNLVLSFVLQIWVYSSLVAIYTSFCFIAKTKGKSSLLIMSFLVALFIAIIAIFTNGMINGMNTENIATFTLELNEAIEAIFYLPGMQVTLVAYQGIPATLDIIKAIFLPLAYGSVATIAGLVVFLKSDIK